MERIDKSYFPIYEKIESEVIKLSSSIYFLDSQAEVFSLDIADLIIRCSVEIESIAKDIYRKELGVEPKKNSECFKWMEDNWKLSRKLVTIISPYFHFEKLKIFAPFDYVRGEPEDYYSCYNAIKHDRFKNMKKATVYTLIRALGALFILNVYFSGKKTNLEEDCYGKKFDRTGGSKIFSFFVAPCMDEAILSCEENIIPETCLYKIVKKESCYAFKISYKNNFDEIRYTSMIIFDDAFQKYAADCLGKSIDFDCFLEEISRITSLKITELREKMMKYSKMKCVTSVDAEKMKTTFVAELIKE